jgi:murein DD-endopeptidase MepM/ murein hydrolase activator NlpD
MSDNTVPSNEHGHWRTMVTLSIVAAAGLYALMSSAPTATGVVQAIHTLPFEGQYIKTCGFGPYSECPPPIIPGFHYGTDYQLGNTATGGHPILASAGGTAKRCGPSPGAGLYMTVYHGNGQLSRYLHLSSQVAAPGQVVERGAVIGYEGISGTDAYHLHFETRHNATGSECLSGTAVDPYAGPYSPGTYAWRTNPPSMRGADWNGGRLRGRVGAVDERQSAVHVQGQLRRRFHARGSHPGQYRFLERGELDRRPGRL